jgi:hypothetical protein
MLNFSGIGAQKSGTTWVYENLVVHPQAAFPAGKEVHYWDLFQERGLDWYKRQFEDSDKVNGDITPAYAILPPDTIKEVHDNFPHLKLFYIMRNPIDRAWSHAMMEVRRAKMDPNEVSDQWLIDHFNSEGSLKRGDYLTCIKNWLDKYPAEQLLVLRYDDISKSPIEFLRTVCKFVGLDPSYFDESKREAVSRKIFAGEGVAIRPTLQEYGATIYTPERAQALEAFLAQRKNLCKSF